ncbi:MAG: hypothetical protein ACRC62_04865 [Microcoleus sp.]
MPLFTPINCFAPTFPFGPSVRFTCRTLDVTLNYADNKFRADDDENQLVRHGWERDIDMEYAAKMFYGWAGASHRDGPPFRAPYVFQGRFHNLTEQEYRRLKAMWLLWLEKGDRTRLYDGRLVLEEAKPRTRALHTPTIAYALPTETDIIYYFPVFDVIWEDFKDFGRTAMGYRIDIKLREWDADQPVPP